MLFRSKQLDGQLVRADDFAERLKQRQARAFAALDHAQLVAVTGQQHQAFLVRTGAFVGKVIGGTGESIDHFDGLAQARWQQYRGNRKIFVVIDGHAVGETAGYTRDYLALAAFWARQTGVAQLYYNQGVAKVAELVDAPDLGSGAERRVGSSPSFRTRTRTRSTLKTQA